MTIGCQRSLTNPPILVTWEWIYGILNEYIVNINIWYIKHK